MPETCQSVTPQFGVRCTMRPHAERFACSARGTSPDGVHWSLTWFRPGEARDDRRADGLPWPEAAAAPA